MRTARPIFEFNASIRVRGVDHAPDRRAERKEDTCWLAMACRLLIRPFPMCYGIQVTFPPRYADGPTATYMTHLFDMRCEQNGIEHRLTKITHPWTNGPVEQINRTIKQASVKRYHHDRHRQLETHLHAFIDAYDYGRRLKTLKGLTPFKYICKIWTTQPDRFTPNPTHHMPGLNS